MLLTLLAGCAGGGGNAPAPGALRPKVDQWLAAALRAHDTRTHATGEHPAAQAEMRRIEAELRAADRAGVRGAVEEKRASLKARRGEVEGRRNSILVVGRAHTEEDRRELDRLAREIERIDLSDRSLADLASGF